MYISLMQVKFPPSNFISGSKLKQLAEILPTPPQDERTMDIDEDPVDIMEVLVYTIICITELFSIHSEYV